MRYLRDIERQSRVDLSSRANDRRQEWFIAPVEWMICKAIRKLKIDTGRDIVKINVYGVPSPEKYDGKIFDGCTDVQVLIDWGETAHLEPQIRSRIALEAYLAGVMTVLKYWGVDESKYVHDFEQLSKSPCFVLEKLASLRRSGRSYSINLEWSERDDFATVYLDSANTVESIRTTVAKTIPDFDSLSSKATSLSSEGMLRIEFFPGFLEGSWKGQRFIEPASSVPMTLEVHENKAVATFDLSLLRCDTEQNSE